MPNEWAEWFLKKLLEPPPKPRYDVSDVQRPECAASHAPVTMLFLRSEKLRGTTYKWYVHFQCTTCRKALKILFNTYTGEQEIG